MLLNIFSLVLLGVIVGQSIAQDSCKNDGSNKATGYYAESTNCQGYYLCVRGLKYEYKCATGYEYDDVRKTCNWAQYVKCERGRVPTTNPLTTTSPTTKTTKQPKTDKPVTTKPPTTKTPAGISGDAKPCNSSICKLPACRCSSSKVPNNLPFSDVPKIITFTMDDGVTTDMLSIYNELLDGNVNPNGCPVKGTFYVSGDWTSNYEWAKSLYDKGHEIGVHTKSHRFPPSWWKTATYSELVDEIIGMRDILERAGIKNLVGYRNPFLQTAGDTTFSVLNDHGFMYDTSLVNNIGNLWFPYTLDYDTTPKPCVIPPCPKKSYSGFWEISLNPVTDSTGKHCSMFDECGRTFTTSEQIYQMFKDMFDRHFATSRAAFPLYGHPTWMLNDNNKFRKEGLKRFLKEMYARTDVYFVSMKQTIDWMKNPQTLYQISRSSGPFSC